jgi:hypothetical protein
MLESCMLMSVSLDWVIHCYSMVADMRWLILSWNLALGQTETTVEYM